MRRVPFSAGVGALLTSLAAFEPNAEAAEPWVDRPITLHRHVFAADVGIGLGHVGYRTFCDFGSCTGMGMNLEGAFGVTETVELGLRTGLRFGNGGRATGAAEYGRTLWTETYDSGGAVFANPELRIRWSAYRGSIAEVGLDGRMFLPFEGGSRLGMMFGVPLAFHASDILRIDTGIYFPVIFSDPAIYGVSVPGYFWFQTAHDVWLGPMLALRALGTGGGGHDPHLLVGFGLGYQAASWVDLKTMFLFPQVDDGVARQWGVGFGLQLRIE